MNKYIERLYNGIIKENPTFIIMLGMCPTLAVTTSSLNGFYMGLTTTVVLAMTNLLISALRKAIPDKVRIPAYIVIIASMVTIVELLLAAFLPALNDALGIYIPLIVVNCIIFGRAESYAAKYSVGLSLFDGIGMGLGFTGAITIIGSIREILGSGSVFGFEFLEPIKNISIFSSLEPVSIFVLAPGAFFVLAVLTAIQNKLKLPSASNVDREDESAGCSGNCGNCAGHDTVAKKEDNK